MMTGGGQDPVSPNGIKRSYTHQRGSTCLSIRAPAGLGMAPCPAHTASSVSAHRCPYSHRDSARGSGDPSSTAALSAVAGHRLPLDPASSPVP